MPRSSEEFLNQFGYKDPAIRRYLPGKNEISKTYNELKNKDTTKLDESVSNKVNILFEKGIKKLNFKNQLTNLNEGEWIPKQTPFGIFYFNATLNLWMNNFGVTYKTLNEFLNFYDYNQISSGGGDTKTIISYFSDDGSYIGYYDSNQKSIDIYSVDYSPVFNLTLQHTLTLGAIPFNGGKTQKCIISNNGNYVIISCPEINSVYFLDSTSDTLLQTITENDLQFGSLVAADKDFYGIAISSTSPSREPSIYDVRNNCYEVSSKIHYYKRNYNSTQTQKFVKIHTNGAWTYAHKTGVDGPTVRSINEFCESYSIFVILQPNVFQDTIVARCSDLVCRGYNWSQSVIALPDDQKNYNSSFLNADNPRYDYITELTDNDQTQVKLAYYYRFPDDYGGGISNKPPSDQELKNLLKLYTQPSVKNFSIVRKLQDGTLYDDKSYTALVGYHNPYQNDIPRNDYTFSYGFTFYTTHVVGTYVEKTYGRTMRTRGIGDGLGDTIALSASYPIYDEYVIDTKIGINDNYVYDVSKLQTGTGGIYTKFIKINRRRSVNKDGTDTWQIQDGENTTTDITIQPSFVPPITDVGTIKILYDNSKASIIENSYLDNSTMTASEKLRFLINPTKPYLSNPSNCPAAEFNLAVDPSIFDENLVSVYVSNQRLFINFDTKTLIFEINNALSYKPVIYIKTIDSLKSYKFTYNNDGLFFSLENKIFTYDTNTDTLILLHTIA